MNLAAVPARWRHRTVPAPSWLHVTHNGVLAACRNRRTGHLPLATRCRRARIGFRICSSGAATRERLPRMSYSAAAGLASSNFEIFDHVALYSLQIPVFADQRPQNASCPFHLQSLEQNLWAKDPGWKPVHFDVKTTSPQKVRIYALGRKDERAASPQSFSLKHSPIQRRA
jgi:hypothetical protein